MFRNTKQANEAILRLLRPLGVARYWNGVPVGPGDAATPERIPSLLSGGQMLMLRVGLDLFNQRGGAELGAMIRIFDRANLGRVIGLLAAVEAGEGAVDAWIAREDAATTGPTGPTGPTEIDVILASPAPGKERPVPDLSGFVDELAPIFEAADVAGFLSPAERVSAVEHARRAGRIGADRARELLDRVVEVVRSA